MTNRASSSHLGDCWRRVDASDDPSFFVRFLDATRARMLDAARRDPARTLAPYAVEQGMQVLDAGCGPADLTALLAGLAGPSGQAVGLDLSEFMIVEGRRRHGAVSNLELHVGDVERLPFVNGRFHRTVATQLLVHVPDPAHALDELVRVTRADGRLVLGEMDWDTLVVATDERRHARAFTRFFADGLRHPLVVRDLPAMLRARGFGSITLSPQVMNFDHDSARRWIIDPALVHARATGVSLDGFEADVGRRAAEDRFFAAGTFYTIVAAR